MWCVTISSSSPWAGACPAPVSYTHLDLAPEFLSEPQELGLPVRGIFYGEEGFRHFFTVKPVAGIEDFQGLKLRVSNDPVMNGMVEGLGANPTVVSFGELYSACLLYTSHGWLRLPQ